jgi:hypothetical protein
MKHFAVYRRKHWYIGPVHVGKVGELLCQCADGEKESPESPIDE